MSNMAISIEHVSKAYHGHTVLRNVTVVERRSSSKLLPDMSRLIPAKSPYGENKSVKVARILTG